MVNLRKSISFYEREQFNMLNFKKLFKYTQYFLFIYKFKIDINWLKKHTPTDVKSDAKYIKAPTNRFI